jgi:microcin C transport system substrate-binding protein
MVAWSRGALWRASAVAVFALACMVAVLTTTSARAQQLTRLTQFAEFGETQYQPGFPHFDYVNPDAPVGGGVRLAAYGTFERINPIPVGPTWPEGLGLIYDSLMTSSEDELASYYPLIAESVEVPDDVAFAIFNLNPKARWHDGHPITAGDFVYAVEVIKQHARPLLREFWRNIESAEALGDHRLKLNFLTRNNWKTLGLAAGLGPQPKHFFEATGRDPGKVSTEPEVYEGAYEIERIEIGRSITYKRVDDYWGKDLPVNIGRNRFDRITYVYFRDLDVAFEAFKAGDIDFWNENEARRWATGYDTPQVRDGLIIRDDTIPINTPRGFAGIVFNTRRPPLDDERVRAALSELFDFEWLQQNIFYGLYDRARSWFPNSDYGVRDFPLPTPEELAILEPFRAQLPEAVFTTAFSPSKTDGTGRIREQLRTAWRLLKQAGWEIQDGKLRNAQTGQPMQLEIVTALASSLRFLEPFGKNLERAGVEASVRMVDTAQYERLTDTFDFDMISIGANFFPPPNEELRTYFSSAAAAEEQSANWAGIRSPVVDQLLEEIVAVKGRSAADLEKLKSTTRALDRVLLWNHYIIPTYYADKNRFAYWDLFGRPKRAPTYGTGFPSSWWWQPNEVALRATRQ